MFRDIDASSCGRKIVAAVGINRYEAWPQLSNAVADARAALDSFERLGFTRFKEPLIDQDATAESIRALVNDELATLGDQDSLILFFAGHGHTVKTQFADGDSTRTGYIIPANGDKPDGGSSRWLRIDSLLGDIARLRARHILVFLDACHSGIALGTSATKWRGESHSEQLEQLHRRRSRRVITSAMDDQLALDGGPVAGHSLFTGCLIEGLAGKIPQQLGAITGTQLGLYLQQSVQTYATSTQTPDFGALEGDRRGELIIELYPRPERSIQRNINATIALQIAVSRNGVETRIGTAWAISTKQVVSVVSDEDESSDTYMVSGVGISTIHAELRIVDPQTRLAIFSISTEMPNVVPIGKIGRISDLAEWTIEGFADSGTTQPISIGGTGIHQEYASRFSHVSFCSHSHLQFWLNITNVPMGLLVTLKGAPVFVDGKVVATFGQLDNERTTWKAVPNQVAQELQHSIAWLQGAIETINNNFAFYAPIVLGRIEKLAASEYELTHSASFCDELALLQSVDLGVVDSMTCEQYTNHFNECRRLYADTLASIHRRLGADFCDFIHRIIDEYRRLEKLPVRAPVVTAWELLIVTPAVPGRQLQRLKWGDKITVGRGPSCDIQLMDAKVSRLHLEIVVHPKYVVVADLGSTFATKVGYERLRGTTTIISGAITIELGDSTIHVSGTFADGSNLPSWSRAPT